jgi:transposase
MGWPLPDGMADSELEAKLLGGSTEGAAPARGVPLWPQIHEQLRRKGVALRLLWQEYRQAHPNGFQYSRFCDLYREWTGALEPVLRLPHEPGATPQPFSFGEMLPVRNPARDNAF